MSNDLLSVWCYTIRYAYHDIRYPGLGIKTLIDYNMDEFWISQSIVS